MNQLNSVFEGVTFTNNDEVLQILQDEVVSVLTHLISMDTTHELSKCCFDFTWKKGYLF